MKTAIYKDIEVREDGAFRRAGKDKEFCFTTQPNSRYCYVRCDGKSQGLHRVVFQAFKGEINGTYDVHHLDRNPKNNAISNLGLLTHRENLLERENIDMVSARNNPQKVIAIFENKPINTFDSYYQASKFFNCCPQAIKNSCKSNKPVKKAGNIIFSHA